MTDAEIITAADLTARQYFAMQDPLSERTSLQWFIGAAFQQFAQNIKDGNAEGGAK